VTIVNVLEARNRLSSLLAEVERGAEVVIARRGRPVARLVPATRRNSTGAGLLRWLDEHRDDRRDRRTAEEIAEIIQAERASWD